MDYNNIEKLVEKYFEGTTNIAEEDELKMFFSNRKDIPENLIYARNIFAFFNEEKSVEYKKELVKTKLNNKRILHYISGIAAIILFALFIIVSNQNTEEKVIYAYINGKPITDRAIAEKYTRQALLAVSQNLDKGTKNLSQLNQLNKVEMLIKKEKE